MRIESGRMLNDYIQPNKKQYCIPVFQRDYAWTSEQCEKLFEPRMKATRQNWRNTSTMRTSSIATALMIRAS